MKKLLVLFLFLFLFSSVYSNPPEPIEGKGGYSGRCSVTVKSDYEGSLDNNDGQRIYDHRWSFKEEDSGEWTGTLEINEFSAFGKPSKCFLTYASDVDSFGGIFSNDVSLSYSGDCSQEDSSYTDNFYLSQAGFEHLWDLYGVSCLDDWWCNYLGTNPNVNEFEDHGSVTKYSNDWNCSQSGYGLKTDIDFEGYEVVGSLCEGPTNIDSTYYVVVDAKDEISSKTDEEALAFENPGHIVLKKDEDASFRVDVRSSDYDLSFLDSDSIIDDKYSCAMPSWFEVEFTAKAMYYDDSLIFGNLNVFNILEDTRSVMKDEIFSKIAFLIEEDGGDLNDYFISTKRIEDKLILHGWTTTKEFGDSIMIVDKMKVRVEINDDKEVRMTITEDVTGEPVNPDVYQKKGYSTGKVVPSISRYGPQIIISKGDVSLFLYEGLLKEFVNNLPDAVHGVQMFQGRSFKRAEKDGKLQAYVHLFPEIREDTIDNIGKYIDESEICCARIGSNYEIPEVDIGLCPQGNIALLRGVGEVEVDASVDIIGGGDWDYLGDVKDGSISMRVEMRDLDYDKKNENPLYCKFQCGVPEEVILIVAIDGNYYDDSLFDSNLFEKVREKAISVFPPEQVKYFFGGINRQFIQSQSQIVNVIENGDVVDSVDDSQYIYEIIKIIAKRNADETVTLTMSDDINFRPLGTRSRILGDHLANRKPLTAISNTVTISEKNPGSYIAFAGLVDSIVASMSKLKDDPRTEGTAYMDFEGNTVTLDYFKEFFIDDLLWYHSARKDSDCCFNGEQETIDGGTTGSGLSVYYFRDPDNFSVEGLAYMALMDKDWTNDVTKRFDSSGEQADYLVYKMSDEDLDFFNYTVLGEVSYRDTLEEFTGSGGIYSSEDNSFELVFYEYPDAEVAIRTINITGLNFTGLEVVETIVPKKSVELKDVLVGADNYISNTGSYVSFLTDFMEWSTS